MKQKLQSLLAEMNQGLVERETTLKLALLTILAGENLVLIGPPGTGKSLVARRIASCFNQAESGNDYFEYLLTKFSTPEELFGPLSINELKQDRFKRNTAGYLPSVRLAFLDEIFKASSSILNALLTILNERIYHNGSRAEKVPLQGLIAASNELPATQEELAALYDRFLTRCFVDYVKEENLYRLFEANTDPIMHNSLNADDLSAITNLANSIAIPQIIRELITNIWLQHREMFKEDRREQLSDRRFKKVQQLLRVSAATNNRQEVDLSDVLLLKDCLWNHPDNTAKVVGLVLNSLQRFSQTQPQVEVSDDLHIDYTPIQIPVRRNVIPGYVGSGTEDDPILISNIDDLLGLDQPNVGQMGYFFRQTEDINTSELESWNRIKFKGHYDGCDFKIEWPRSSIFFHIFGRDDEPVFSTIEADSSVVNLELKGFLLADGANKSQIQCCRSDCDLIINQAIDCHIIGCHAQKIAREVEGCLVSSCSSRKPMITDYVKNSIIENCIINLDVNGSQDERLGAITYNMLDGSVVDSCIVSGRASYSGAGYFYLYTVAVNIESGTVKNCITGPLEISSSDVRISGICSTPSSVIFDNNYIFDNINKEVDSNDPNGNFCGRLAKLRFNQRFLEHTLKWDFLNTWELDGLENTPKLRKFNPNIVKSIRSKERINRDRVDMLTSQIKNNIWL